MKVSKLTFLQHKVDIIHYVSLVALTAFLTRMLWQVPGQTFLGADLAFHINRNIGTYYAWLDGQIIPQVNPLGVEGLGYGVNIFYGPLTSMIVAGLFALTHSLYFAYNFTQIMAIFLSGWGMRKFIAELSGNKHIAIFAAFAYMCSYYLLFTTFVMQDEGALASFPVFPVLLLGLWRIVNQKKHGIRTVAICGAILATTHVLSAFVAVIFSIMYLVLNANRLRLKQFRALIIALVSAGLLSAWYILPFLNAKKLDLYGVFDESKLDMGRSAYWMNLRRFDMNILSGGNQKQLILVLATVLIAGLFVWINFRSKRDDGGKSLSKLWLKPVLGVNGEIQRFAIQASVISLIAVFFAGDWFDWANAPEFFYNFQYPGYRFDLLLTLFGAPVVGLGLYLIAKYIYVFVGEKLLKMSGSFVFKGVITAVIAAAYIVSFGFLSVTKTYGYAPTDITNYASFAANGAVPEYIPYKLLGHLDEVSDEPTVLQGDVTVEHYLKTGTEMNFYAEPLPESLNAGQSGSNDVIIELPALYYDGYKAKLHGEPAPIAPSERGLVQVTIPAGYEGNVNIRFGISSATGVGAAVSVLTVVGCASAMGIIVFRRRRSRAEG